MAIDPNRHIISLTLRDEFGNELPAQALTLRTGDAADAPLLSPVYASNDDQDTQNFADAGAPPLVTDDRGRLNVWTTTIAPGAVWVHYAFDRRGCPVAFAEPISSPFVSASEVNISGFASEEDLLAESRTREAADDSLTARIASEEGVRAAADGALGQRITALEALPPGTGGGGGEGANGWSPVLSVESDNIRRVLRVRDWVGGTGTKPTERGYVGAGPALLPSAVGAIDIRGAAGADGTDGDDGDDGANGWTPRFAIETDGERRVMRVTGWSGGVGAQPAAGYVGAGGVGVALSQATDLRGEQGEGGTGGGTPTGIAYSQLSNALQSLIDGKADQSALTAERTAREAADTALGTRIDDEITDRADGDTALGTRLDTETSSRSSADTALGLRIDQEITDRGSADTALGTRITALEGAPPGGGADGEDGDDGWSPILSVVPYINDVNSVLQVSSWTGGTGTPPPSGSYLGPNGFTDELRSARPIGVQGDAGSDGWTPRFAVRSDGERRVLRIVTWTGGTGISPSEGFVGPNGIVASASDAIDIRGPAGEDGSGGGIPDGGVTFDNLATALQTLINGKADQSALDDEITARTNGDTALGTRIDTEVSDRTSADTALGTRIDGLDPQLVLRVENDVLQQSVDGGTAYTNLGTFGGGATPPTPASSTITWEITDYSGTLANYDNSSATSVDAVVGVPSRIDTSASPATLGQDFLVTTADGFELTAMVNQALNNDELHSFEVADLTGGGKAYRIANLRAGAYFIYEATIGETE